MAAYRSATADPGVSQTADRVRTLSQKQTDSEERNGGAHGELEELEPGLRRARSVGRQRESHDTDFDEFESNHYHAGDY